MSRRTCLTRNRHKTTLVPVAALTAASIGTCMQVLSADLQGKLTVPISNTSTLKTVENQDAFTFQGRHLIQGGRPIPRNLSIKELAAQWPGLESRTESLQSSVEGLQSRSESLQSRCESLQSPIEGLLLRTEGASSSNEQTLLEGSQVRRHAVMTSEQAQSITGLISDQQTPGGRERSSAVTPGGRERSFAVTPADFDKYVNWCSSDGALPRFVTSPRTVTLTGIEKRCRGESAWDENHLAAFLHICFHDSSGNHGAQRLAAKMNWEIDENGRIKVTNDVLQDLHSMYRPCIRKYDSVSHKLFGGIEAGNEAERRRRIPATRSFINGTVPTTNSLREAGFSDETMSHFVADSVKNLYRVLFTPPPMPKDPIVQRSAQRQSQLPSTQLEPLVPDVQQPFVSDVQEHFVSEVVIPVNSIIASSRNPSGAP